MASMAPITPAIEILVPRSGYVAGLARNFTGDLVQGPLVVLKDIKRYRQIHPTHSAFGPPPETSHIRQKLIDDGVLSASHDGGVSQWSDFIVKPSKMAATEGVVFEPLITIISK